MQGYWFLVTEEGESIFQDAKKISFFKQSDRISNGHDVLHFKGTYTPISHRVTLDPGYDFLYQEEQNPGTSDWRPAGYVYQSGSGWFVILPNQTEQHHVYGRGLTKTTIRNCEFIYEYEESATSKVHVFGDNFSASNDYIYYTWHRIFYDRGGNIESEESYLQAGTLVDEVNLDYSDTEMLERIFYYRLDSLFNNMLEGFESRFHGNYAYVCADACNTIMYPHHNVVMNTMEILNLKKSVGDMYQDFTQLFVNQPRSKRVRSIAAAYLGTKYGPRLTVKEAVDILEHDHSLVKKGTATGTRNCDWNYYSFDFTSEDRVSFTYEFGSYLTFQNTLNSWGLSPISLEDIWDAVPYSFVVDWFYDVSDHLENSRRQDFIDHLPVSKIWRSEKSHTSGSLFDTEENRLIYSLNIYSRENMQGLSSQIAGYTSSQGITAQGHIPELGAVAVNLLV
jgi:hypothetical protein